MIQLKWHNISIAIRIKVNNGAVYILALACAMLYATRRVLRITELLPEQGQGNLSKRKAWAALQKDLGQVGGLFMGLYSIPYIRSTQDRRFMYEMTQMLDVFKQANKATPPKDEADAEERATWLQESLEKIRKRIEEIRE